MKKLSTKATAILLLTLIIMSCEKPDEVPPACSSGKDIRTINDDLVPQSIKDKIFKPAPGSTYYPKSNPASNVNGKTLVIPVEYPSLPRNTSITVSKINDDFFSTAGFGNNSINSYFIANSYGEFKLTNAGTPSWVSLIRDTAFYNAGQPGNDRTLNVQLAKDVCEAASVDWNAMDLNHDRKITGTEVQIVFLYSEPTSEVTKSGAARDFSFMISTKSGSFTISNKFVFILCKNNSDPTKDIDPIAYNYVTLRHELIHAFFGTPGPDRYANNPYGTGDYDPMSNTNEGSTMMNMVDRMKLGWITPKILSYDHTPDPQKCYSFPNSELNKAALVLYNDRYPDECWVVENRFKTGSTFPQFDSGLPESGLAVWWLNLKTEQIFIVNASKAPGRPDTVAYPKSGALFQSTKGYIPLYPAVGPVAFFLRKVSAPGLTMYAEF